MEPENKYNIKFIKISGILYILGVLYIPISLIWDSSSSSGGGNNGGGGGAIYAIGIYILIGAVVLTFLNFTFSKPKPEDKYLRFLPIFILIAAILLFVTVTFLGLRDSLVVLVGILFLFIKIFRKK